MVEDIARPEETLHESVQAVLTASGSAPSDSVFVHDDRQQLVPPGLSVMPKYAAPGSPSPLPPHTKPAPINIARWKFDSFMEGSVVVGVGGTDGRDI